MGPSAVEGVVWDISDSEHFHRILHGPNADWTNDLFLVGRKHRTRKEMYTCICTGFTSSAIGSLVASGKGKKSSRCWCTNELVRVLGQKGEERGGEIPCLMFFQVFGCQVRHQLPHNSSTSALGMSLASQPTLVHFRAKSDASAADMMSFFTIIRYSQGGHRRPSPS